MFDVISNPMIVGLRLPERCAGAVKYPVGFPRGKTFPALHNSTQGMIRLRPEHCVDVIRHDDPSIQKVAFFVKKSQSVCDQVCDFRPLEPAFPFVPIQKSFQFAKVIPLDVFQRRGIRPCSVRRLRNLLFGMQTVKAFGALRLVFNQNFAWQRIREAKRNEVTCAFPFHVRQISTRMRTRPQRICSLQVNSTRTKFELHTLDARRFFRRKHPSTLAHRFCDLQAGCGGVPQRSAELHTAVSQIWNLRRGRGIRKLHVVPSPAEFNSAIQQIKNLRYQARRMNCPSTIEIL
jgi:hypothetical protein